MRAAPLLAALAISACAGELSQIEPGQAPSRTAAPSAAAGMAGLPRGTAAGSATETLTPYAAESQLRRLDQIATDAAAGTADEAELRRVRQQAQALSSTRTISRPAMGSSGAAPVFEGVPTADPMILGIQRAQAVEARAAVGER
ncbi:hypothetical protein [Poseidonocella sp. HB161398]|uniref:hypothetical protein n=1 Tax=Poseidonocella sp. HB161398 TaxID=2320855 RepID=UPI001109CB1C|nr:hypothetical protein [Poseidonocella sp. HB161398]